MSYHLRTIFSGRTDSPHMAFRMWNANTVDAEPGDVVCFYPHLTTTDRMWFAGYTAGDQIMSDFISADDAIYRVAGVVQHTIAHNTSGIVAFGGIVNECYVTGTVAANDRLILSAVEKTAEAATAGADAGKGWTFGFAMESGSGNRRTIRALLVPWRI